MFLTARITGNFNFNTHLPLHMLTYDAAGLGYLRQAIEDFPRPILTVPISGSARILNGAGPDAHQLAMGGDGTQDRLITVTEGFRVFDQPFITPHYMTGRGAWASLRIDPRWDDDLMRGAICVGTVIQRGDTRPMTAVDGQGRMYSADDLAAMAWAEGLELSTYDIQALSQFAIGLGFTLETLAGLPILSPIVGEDEDGAPVYGDAWKALHAFVKCYAVGLGAPRIPAVVDTTAGMLSHPVTRGLLAIGVRSMVALGWPLDRLERSKLSRPFL